MAIIKSTSARRTSTVKSTASKSASSKTAASKSTSSKSSGTLNSNGYRDNFDYSAAIAGTTDSAKRQQLLSERQNKIDSLGLGGKGCVQRRGFDMERQLPSVLGFKYNNRCKSRQQPV